MKKRRKVYFIPAGCTSKEIFSNLNLINIDPIYLEYFKPINENESIESYALRMSKEITEPNPIIVGVCFGGIIAHEISLLIAVKKIIIISGIKYEKEKSFVLKILKLVANSNFLLRFLVDNIKYIYIYIF